jgi:hypothetical protein
MPTFTTSQLHVSSMRLWGEFTLQELAEQLNRKKPSHALLEGGWASLNDEGSNIKVLNAAPPESDVEILPEVSSSDTDGSTTVLYPERLVARYYYFTERKGLAEANPASSNLELHEVTAIDICISRINSKECLLLASTSNTGEAKKHPLNKLLLSAQSLDSKARIEVDSSPIGLPSADLYLWLLVRARDNPALDSSTEIRSIEAVHGQDHAYRKTVLNDDVSFDRPGFLIAVAEGDELGPAKLTLVDSAGNSRVCFQLWQSGRFHVITSATHYADEVETAVWRLKSVFDLTYRFIPLMIQAHEVDSAWHKTVRTEEIRQAAELLAERYSVQP